MTEISLVGIVRTLYGHSSDVAAVAIQNNILATCSSDKTVRLWTFDKTPEDVWEVPFSPLLGHKYTVHACCFSPTEPLLITCSTDGNIYFWSALNGELEATLNHPSGLGIRACCISTNGTLLATAGEDDSVVIWDVKSRTLLRSVEGHEATVTACAFSPDGNFLISGSTNGDIAVWDAQYGGNWLARTLEAHDLGVLCANFSPTYLLNNGDKKEPQTTYLLATCGNDNVVRLWHVKTGGGAVIELYQELQGHSANVWCCKFSNNGDMLATAGGDKTVIIWDPLQGAILQKLDRHSRYVTCCAFSSDGNYVVSGSNDKTVIIWKLDRQGAGNIVAASSGPIASAPIDPSRFQRSFCIPNKDSTTPEEFYCPITQELMKDPVIASDGFTYERSAITSWFHSGKDTSPMTNDRLTHMQLTPNIVLKMLIHKRKEL